MTASVVVGDHRGRNPSTSAQGGKQASTIQFIALHA